MFVGEPTSGGGHGRRGLGPEGAAVGAILSDGKVVLPAGDTIIKENNRVVIFAESRVVKQIEQMFRVSIDFF